MKKNYLTKKELAGRLSRSVRTIDNWMSQRIIPFIRIGGTVLFEEDAVDRALEKFTHKSRYLE